MTRYRQKISEIRAEIAQFQKDVTDAQARIDALKLEMAECFQG